MRVTPPPVSLPAQTPGPPPALRGTRITAVRLRASRRGVTPGRHASRVTRCRRARARPPRCLAVTLRPVLLARGQRIRWKRAFCFGDLAAWSGKRGLCGVPRMFLGCRLKMERGGTAGLAVYCSCRDGRLTASGDGPIHRILEKLIRANKVAGGTSLIRLRDYM